MTRYIPQSTGQKGVYEFLCIFEKCKLSQVDPDSLERLKRAVFYHRCYDKQQLEEKTHNVYAPKIAAAEDNNNFI
jgi:hypothetical protein